MTTISIQQLTGRSRMQQSGTARLPLHHCAGLTRGCANGRRGTRPRQQVVAAQTIHCRTCCTMNKPHYREEQMPTGRFDQLSYAVEKRRRHTPGAPITTCGRSRRQAVSRPTVHPGAGRRQRSGLSTSSETRRIDGEDVKCVLIDSVRPRPTGARGGVARRRAVGAVHRSPVAVDFVGRSRDASDLSDLGEITYRSDAPHRIF